MGRTTISLVGLLTAAALAGCSGSAEAPAPDPSPSPSSSAPPPSSTPAPTAPVMPDAAKAHTKAGAKAFVEYFWEVVDYAQATGETDQLASLTMRECKNCAAGIKSIRQVYAKGGRILGGESTLTDIRAQVNEQQGTHFAYATFTVDFAAQRSDFPGTDHDKQTKTRRARDEFTLVAAGDAGWAVATFRAIP